LEIEMMSPSEDSASAIAKLKIVVPLTLAIIFLLLYLNFGTLIVMLSLPFALVGGS